MSARVTSCGVDVLRQGTPKARVTSVAVDVLLPDEPAQTLEVTAASLQVVHTDVPDAALWVTQAGVEAIAGGDSSADVTQLGVEVLAGGDSGADVTQTGVEVLYQATAFLGCVDRPVAYRLRVRNAADNANAVVFTSLADETLSGASGWPVMLDAPQIDASTLNPLSGKTDLGACTIRVADPVLVAGALGCATTGATRLVTALLANGAGRSQLIGRRVFVEASDDNGTTWGAYWSGFLTDVSFPDAITAELQMAHSGRDDERRQVFGTLNNYAFDTTGNLAGGPVRVNVPTSASGWRVQYNEAPWTIECTAKSGDLVTFTITNRFLPWDVALERGNKKLPLRFLNQQIQKYFQLGGPTPALTTTWRALGRGGWFPRVECAILTKNGSAFPAAFPPVAAPTLLGLVGSTNTTGSQSTVVFEDSGEQFALYWPLATGTQPTVGDDFTMYLRPVDISEANPGWIVQRHPVDILVELWTRAGYATNTASVTTTKAALGDYRVALRITRDMTLADASAMLCGAFGFGWRMDPAGQRVVFPTRAYGATLQTITVDDLASTDGVVWATSEASKVGRVAYQFQQFYTWPAAQDGDETTKPSRALDGVVAVDMEPVIAEAPTATDYGVRTQTYEVPGYVFDASGRPLDAFGFVDAQAVPILAAYQDGEISTEIDVLPTVTALEGDVVELDITHRPGFDVADSPVAQRGTPELAMVVSRQPQPWGARLKLVRVGAAGDPITDTGDAPTTVTLDPTVSVAATTGATATFVTVTLDDDTDYVSAGATVRVYYAVQATQPTDNGTLWPVALDPSVASTLDVGPFPPASTVWIRTQTVQSGVPVAGFTAWQSVTLAAQTGVGSSGGLQTPTVLLSVSGGVITADVDGGPNAVKAYCAASSSAFPSAATVLAGSTDTTVPFSFASILTIAAGATAYVAAITEDAAGNRSLRGVALYTRPDGAGSGGTVLYTAFDPFAPPAAPSTLDKEFETAGSGVPTGWTDVGALTPTITTANRRLLMTCAANAGASMAAIEQTLPAGNFAVYCHVTLAARLNFNAAGIYLRNTTSGLLLASRIGRANSTIGNTYVNGEKFSSFTTRTSSFSSFDHYQQAAWLRMRYDGTTLYLDVSFDGIDFFNYHSETLATYFSGGNLPNRVGLTLGSFSTNTPTAAFRAFRYFDSATAEIGRDVSIY